MIIVFVSTTGMATPQAPMRSSLISCGYLQTLKGYRCSGWAAQAGCIRFCVKSLHVEAKENPKAVVLLLVGVELCSLTFLSNDFSKSNFIASTLFSDGVAVVLVKGRCTSEIRQRRKNKLYRIAKQALSMIRWM